MDTASAPQPAGEVSEFGTWLAATAGLAPGTVRAYTGHLADYSRWWDRTHAGTPLVGATPVDVEAYLAHLADRGLAASTRRTALHGLRAYYRGLHRHQADPASPDAAAGAAAAASNPAGQVRRPRVPKPRTLVYTEAEADAILIAAAQTGAGAILTTAGGQGSARAHLDHAVLATLRWTGLRASELCGLTVPDVDLEQRVLHVLGKGAKHRLVPIPAALAELLQTYLTQHRPHLVMEAVQATEGAGALEVLFLNPDSPRQVLTQRALLETCRRHGTAAGVRGAHTSLRWRHTYASLTLARGGVDLHTLSRILGHAQIATSERYLHLATDDLRGAIERAYPPPAQDRALRAAGQQARRPGATEATWRLRARAQHPRGS